MTCNIVFDYLSPHNGEYWFKCATCGARDWFSYSQKPSQHSTLKSCVAKNVEQLDASTKKLVLQAYKNGYAAAVSNMSKAADQPNVSYEQALKL